MTDVRSTLLVADADDSTRVFLAEQLTGRRTRCGLRGQRIVLSHKEFALLDALCEQPAGVYTKEELLRDVWGFRSPGQTRTLDSHACRLRTKLGAAAGDRLVVNVWGVGYRLVDTVPIRLGQAA